MKTASELADHLQNIIHTNEEFRESFSRVRMTRGSLARYMLAALERTKKGLPEPELVPNEDETAVNLEHILPRNPAGTEWPQFTDEQRRSYLHRLGNLALLSRGPNGRIGNKPFSDKEPILEASELLLTKAAGAATDWTPAVVDERQSELAELAVLTWTADL